MVNTLIQFMNPRWRWKQSGKHVKPANVEDTACVISIVDDRLYHGIHPLADPFSMARIPSKNISQSSRNSYLSNKSTSDQTKRMQPTSALDPETEDIGVYSQRDVMIMSFPFYSDQLEQQAKITPTKSIVAQSSSLREQQQIVITTRRQEMCLKSSERDEEEEEFLLSTISNDEVTAVGSSASNLSPSDFSLFDDETTGSFVVSNQNTGCWIEMCTTLCTSVVPTTTSRNRKSPSGNARQNAMQRNANKQKFSVGIDSDAVQTNPRRYKQQQQYDRINRQESEREQPPPSEQKEKRKKSLPVLSLRLAPSKERHHSGFTEVKAAPKLSTPPLATPGIVYPIARYSELLNNAQLVERRRRSLRKFLTFQPVVMPEEAAELFKAASSRSENSDL
jgi:hypothetical protein